MYPVRKSTIILSVFCLSLTLASCDLINPPKKKKEVAKPAALETEPAAPSVEDSGQAQAPLPGDVVARVGSWTLTSDQFTQRLKLLKEGLPDFDSSKPGNKELVLNELIRQQLLVKDAEETGVSQQKDITEAVEDFRRTLLVQEVYNKLTKDVTATEKEAQDYYEQNKKMFVDPVQWKVRQIVVPDEAAAKNILVQVLQGGDFAEIAKTQSKAKNAVDGGALPTFTEAPFEAMQIALASLDTGGVSSVFKGSEGYYIVKVEDKKGGQPKTFEEVKAYVISGLTRRKQQEVLLEHINRLAEKNKVEINKSLIGTGTGSL